jgi:hypothetical protein
LANPAEMVVWVLDDFDPDAAPPGSPGRRAHLPDLSGVTFREAVRRLPAQDKARLELRRAG